LFFIFRRDAFAGVEEEEIQSFLYDSDGCYNSSLFQASSVSTMTTFENLLRELKDDQGVKKNCLLSLL
jgi:hypothetical protein